MAKKDKELRGGLDVLFNGKKQELLDTIEDAELKEALQNRAKGAGRPRTREDKVNRTSIVMDSMKHRKLKEIAARENLTIKEIFDLAITWAIERYEAKHGVISQREKKNIEDIF